MTADVVVTGYGVRTAFGSGPEAATGGVFDGRTTFRRVRRFDTTGFRSGFAAVPDDTATPSLSAALAEVADAAVGMADLPPGDAAVLLGTAGDFTAVTRFWRSGGEDATGVEDTVPAALADSLAARFGARGPRYAFTNACVASATAIATGCALIASGRVDGAICAGGYLVEVENQAKFDSGWALAKDGTLRPFSAGRSGLLLGDGAAAVVLESADAAHTRGAPALARVSGWGMASDAHHVARPHPGARGLVAASRIALRRAGARRVDYVNAHGTGTKHNDVAETRGFHELFGPAAATVPISSTKGTTGHLLEGSGAVEFAIALTALRSGLVPPTAGFTEPDPACDLDYVPNEAREAPLRRVLTVNAAFGGANTALILEAV
ncbi:beta-ketoacyl-[acyl-carrier-protein] synthase family protein [Amycolatopsis sp. CA-230715]|uniref:beta-ketoacyl-[acyl-carrier-protein] synthase family protein n=1 Tax=Amycolatopsis sp. CA-230715 TaxID=2745196 RepID=UPI001C02A028|nr:beta-ketoacyl-[acyl-carrier-protein] synthase family protein [Amycolatopsis sp. CA-230715]QWF85216.1 3-oxoacyl-[acyl-carrier-protein] synthase 2 [Amycolatopsis sp. CA-230715]